MSWASRRRAIYLGSTITVLLLAVSIPLFFYLYEAPNCFDGKQNKDEVGIDCGGACDRLCSSQVTEPTIRWSRSFEVTPGNYSAVAYVENPNPKAAATDTPFSFQLFDGDGLSIAEKTGSAFLLPNRVTPIFVSDISTGNRIPVRTFFAFTDTLEWYRADDRSSELVVTNRVLSRPDTAPRIDATLENTSVHDFTDIDITAVIFGTDGNAVAASRTFIELLPGRSEAPLVFTWSQPLPKRIEACTTPVDVVLLLDVSGSMNNVSDIPPQPITDAKRAATAFLNRLEVSDRSGAVSFATKADKIAPLSLSHDDTRTAVDSVFISSEEEQGVTNIGAGIGVAAEELTSVRHNQNARPVVVLLTDGRANAPDSETGEAFALERARAAKDSGIAFYTIGLGESVSDAFLRDIAGSESRTFRAATGEDLDGIYREISAEICERGAAVIDILPKTRDAFRRIDEVR